jgi:hypothetical protein
MVFSGSSPLRAIRQAKQIEKNCVTLLRARQKGEATRTLAKCGQILTSTHARRQGLKRLTNPKTAYDRVKAALGSIRANINDCEYSAVRDLADMWPEIESAAISAGLLKAVE